MLDLLCFMKFVVGLPEYSLLRSVLLCRPRGLEGTPMTQSGSVKTTELDEERTTKLRSQRAY